MDSLIEIYKRHSGGTKFNDKGSVHSYLDVYSEILAPYRETAKNVLEIGIYDGHSLLMWKEYFVNAKVYGIDCDEQPHGGLADLRPMIKAGHNITIMDAESKEQLNNHFASDLKWDVIIEDAGHHIDQQLKIYDVFKDRLTNGGMYVIEDLQTIEAQVQLRAIGFDIIDRRHIKKRYDDVLAVLRRCKI